AHAPPARCRSNQTPSPNSHHPHAPPTPEKSPPSTSSSHDRCAPSSRCSHGASNDRTSPWRCLVPFSGGLSGGGDQCGALVEQPEGCRGDGRNRTADTAIMSRVL